MAGICVIFFCLFILPVIMLFMVFIAGFAIADVFVAVISTVALIILKKKKLFEKWKSSENKWYRYGAKISEFVLTAIVIFSWFIAALSLYGLFKLGIL